MSEAISLIKIFAASPGDVTEERGTLGRVIQKLNLTIGPLINVRLELVRWETHVYPDVGLDAQDVVNRQLLDDADIFIGMLWRRFGTPTGRAESGTEEEFERALHRKRAGGTIKIMMYFKDTPLQPSQIDPLQLERVQKFKARVATEGGLHWSFLDRFDELVELHIARYLQELHNRSGMLSRGVERHSEAQSSTEQEVYSDDGLLEQEEGYRRHFTRLVGVQTRINEALHDLGERMSERANEMNDAVEGGHRANSLAVNSITQRTAEDLIEFVNRIELEVPLFANEFETGIAIFIRNFTVSRDVSPDGQAEIAQVATEVTAVITNIDAARTAVKALRSAALRLPRLTVTLNRARRRTIAVLDRLISEFDAVEMLMQEVETILSGVE